MEERSLVPVSNAGVTITTNGAKIGCYESIQDWCKDLIDLVVLHANLPIAIGDMLVYGEERWPHEFAQAIEPLCATYSPDTIRNYMSIARRVPPGLRPKNVQLRLGHFEAVASLPAPTQQEILQKAADQSLDRTETRALASAARGDPVRVNLRMRGSAWKEYRKDTAGDKLVIVIGNITEWEGGLVPGPCFGNITTFAKEEPTHDTPVSEGS